mmetsp:Transcript_5468/g.15234  ORF Transcript_5468/g.15234 Transcript_5468/m.15234 type:complete len:342 (-) Transcript_5468:191-1216(-)
MQCVPGTRPSTDSSNFEHMVTASKTPIRRLNSLVKGQPLLEINKDVTNIDKVLVRNISNLQAPTFVDRKSLIVNYGAATDNGSLTTPHAFRRMTSKRRHSITSLNLTALSGMTHSEKRSKPSSLSSSTTDGVGAESVPGIITESAEEEDQVSDLPQQGGTVGNKKMSKWTPSRKNLQMVMQQKLRQKPTTAEIRLPEAQRLQERLSSLSLSEVEQAGDGNCQFRSISHQLYGSPSWHSQIRKKVVVHIKTNPEYFEGFLGECLADYCEEMAELGSWGDELTLRAAADCLGVTIHVLTSEPENWYMVYEPEEHHLEKEVFLCYIAPIHYNSVIRLKQRGSES